MAYTEFDLIEQTFKKAAKLYKGVVCGIGDDAAITEPPSGHQLVISTDTMVGGIHFFEDALAYDIGYKSLAVNLSDMAAMGAEPLWATLSLTLPGNNRRWLQDFAEGFFYLANQYNTSLVGGDLSGGPLSVTVQITGSVPANTALRRSTAKPGDDIYVSGQLGMAALALSVLQGDRQTFRDAPSLAMEKLNRPEPRIYLGMRIRDVASAAIDVSDGLAADLAHILVASDVGAEIEVSRIPVYEKLRSLEDKLMWRYALNTGDDYELCFTAPAEQREMLEVISCSCRHPVTRIGRIVDGHELKWLSADGQKIQMSDGGFRHF